jgi:hypothetical protein
MIIILEGPDGSGKTTLAHDLQQRFNLAYHHEGPPPPNVPILDHLGTVLDGYRGKNVVIDRFALGERVYGPIVRGHDSLGADGWKVIRRLMRAVGAMEVLCLPSYDTCYAAWSSGRAEMFNKVEHFKQFYAKYVELKGDQYIYDYSDPVQLEHMISICRSLQSLEGMLGLPANMVGSAVASYLFVGERGANPQATHDLPFFSSVNSSRYLNDAIAAAGFNEGEIAFINAYKHDKTPNVIPRNFKTVVALGGHASAVCNQQHIRHRFVYHPQYWKRFHSPKVDEYVRMLRKCRDGINAEV